MSAGSLTPGRIVWHEMNSQEPTRSAGFYAELFGWRFDSSDPHYTMIFAGSAAVGGMIKLRPPEVPSHWLPYVSVADVDASAARAAAAGCKLVTQAMNVPRGRFQLVREPQGALFCLWRGAQGDPTPSEAITTGHFCWNQVNSPNAAASFEAYAAIFGWERQAGFASSSAAELSTLLVGSQPVAGLMQGPSGMPGHWLCYVAVDSLDRTRDRAVRLGGKVFIDRIPVASRGAFCVLQDSLGAVFAAFEPMAR